MSFTSHPLELPLSPSSGSQSLVCMLKTENYPTILLNNGVQSAFDFQKTGKELLGQFSGKTIATSESL